MSSAEPTSCSMLHLNPATLNPGTLAVTTVFSRELGTTDCAVEVSELGAPWNLLSSFKVQGSVLYNPYKPPNSKTLYLYVSLNNPRFSALFLVFFLPDDP